MAIRKTNGVTRQEVVEAIERSSTEIKEVVSLRVDSLERVITEKIARVGDLVTGAAALHKERAERADERLDNLETDYKALSLRDKIGNAVSAIAGGIAGVLGGKL